MNVVALGCIVGFVIFAGVDGITKVKRCKSTFRSSQDPACSMITMQPNNSMMCTSADVLGEVSGYFSIAEDVVPLCVTYIFKSDPPIGTDDFPEGIWLFRSVNFDSRFNNCSEICKFVRESTAGSNYKNFFISCNNDTDSNDDNVTDFWNIHTQYDCSTDDKYYSKGSEAPIEVTTTPAPSTSANPTTAALPIAFVEKFGEVFAGAPVAEVAADTTAAASTGGSNANLFIGIAEGVIGILGTAIIATSAVVLYLTCKKLPGGKDTSSVSPSE